MANEATISAGLSIVNGNLIYVSQPSSYRADVTTTKGPTPGLVVVPTTGVNVDLSKLTHPGLCRIINYDSTNYVRWGIHDGTLFHPVGRLLPGEIAVFRLDADLGEEEAAAGTGSTGGLNSFYLKAVGGTCNCSVEAFEN